MDSEELGLEDAPPVCVSEGLCVRDIELLTVTDGLSEGVTEG